MKIGIVGAGIAGLAAARAIATTRKHEAIVFEAGPRAGGHAHTVQHDGHAIDMGFIVCNRDRYPLFMRMLGELGIATRPTVMAFSVALGDYEWSSASLGALFPDRARLADRRHWRFLLMLLGFLRRARADLAAGSPLLAESLDDYLAAHATHPDLRERFVIPLAAALWSLAPERCGAFPAETFFRFLDQHGMLRPVGPLAWETVVGGSQRYVEALVAELAGSGTVALHVDTPVDQIARDAHGVTLVARGIEHRVDRVIVATHADTALALLAHPTDDERAVLGAFTYSANATVLHRDATFLPRAPRAHAAWNYVADRDVSRVAVTYSMTKLQGLPADPPYLLTLNPRRDPRDVIARAMFTHPQFDRAALDAQALLPGLGAARRTHYCGAHFGFGFHEDGMRSGLAALASALAW